MEQIPNARTVKGYTKLPETSQIIFGSFLRKFFYSQGTYERSTLIPKSIKLVRDSEGVYLRFDYEMSQCHEWMHVSLRSGDWY